MNSTATTRQRSGPVMNRQDTAGAVDWVANASGNVYLSVMPREDLGRVPARTYRGRVPIANSPEVCDHGVTVCASWECVESWSIDYRLNFHRTGGGRRLAELIGLEDPGADIRPDGGIAVLPAPSGANG